MEAHKIDSRGVYFTGKSADAHEGVQSFLEKRPAEFKNKVSRDMPRIFSMVGEKTIRIRNIRELLRPARQAGRPCIILS